MKSHALLFCAFCALALVGCTNGQGDADVTESSVATFPGLSPAAAAAVVGTKLATDAAVTIDMKDELASLGQYGTLSALIAESSVSGSDLSFVKHIRTTLGAADGTLPAEVMSDVEVPEGALELTLPLVMTAADIVARLKEGPVTLHIYVTGSIPNHPLKLTEKLTAHVSLAVKVSG